ncbi:MAG: DNA translocase FtsK 4TM domain-containing protein [Thermovirgaceae bacterium]
MRKPNGENSIFPAVFSGGRAAVGAFLIAMLLADLFLLASFFRFQTGELGAWINRSLLIGIFGGGVLIFLVYGLYALPLALFEKNSGRPVLRETAGTTCLYLCAALVLGMREQIPDAGGIFWMNPGIIGRLVATSLFRYVGITGAVITGFALLFATVWLYGIVSKGELRDLIFLPAGLLKKFFSRRESRKTGARGEKEVPLRTDETTGTKREARRIPGSGGGKEEGLVLIRRHKGEKVQQLEASPEDDDADDYGEYVDVPDSTGLFGDLDVEAGHFPPPLELFGEAGAYSEDIDEEEIAENGRHVISTLKEFNIEAELAETIVGPTVMQYRLQLAPGIKVSRVSGLANDMAVALAVPSLRVEAPIPGKPYVGIEVPNPSRKAVNLRSILEHPAFSEGANDLPLGIGVAVDGRHLTIGLEKLPHLLVAGTTGSGKSVFISCCIASLCYSRRPEEMKLLLIDPKRVEMKIYERLPHTLMPPVVDAKKAVHALGWAIREMEKRYELFAQARVRNLKGYNAKALPKDRLPSIVIIIDELADLMFTSPKEVEDYICRLAQMARATGIHLIIATQRPSVNVVTGLIKANVPARVAFTLPSQTDSRTVLDIGGAEKLLGSGDMLFSTPRLSKPMRLQGPMLEEAAINRFIDYLVVLFGEPEHIDLDEQLESRGGQDTPFLDDPLVEEAVNIILQSGIASASRLQRQLRIGFTRAARLVDTIEQMGIVGAQDGARPREILVDEDEAQQILEEHLRGGM